MFDTMTMTKIVGAFCGAFLVFLLGNWAGELIYHADKGHGYGDDHASGFVIEVAEAEGASDEPVEEIDFAALMAEADPAEGEGVYRKCASCHKLEDGANGTGPHLFGVVGRAVASVDGYSYSGSLVTQADTWTPENLQAFLENPKGWAPGTKMSFAGLKKPEERADLIAYLQTFGG